MTGHIYRDVILEQHVRLFRGAMVAEFLFMDDNARPHRGNIVDECLQSEDITRMDWPAYSPDLNPIEHSVAWPSGKTIGGSGVINGMLNLRGNKKNYDDWAANGAHGWSYDAVLRYFKKLEDNTNAEYVKNGYHGTGGPVTVSKPLYDSELKAAVLEAAKDKGYRIGDINGPDATGFYDFQATMRAGQRCSAAKAYLAPNDHKENLDIVSGAFVKKIIINSFQALGVVYDFKGKTREVRAYKEVIVSAGTVNTAQLLMLSGIGPSEELAKHNASCLNSFSLYVYHTRGIPNLSYTRILSVGNVLLREEMQCNTRHLY
ncbi:glucose dehydrogenase [Trichonephila clavipes]|nr:glucose dehydrogenase [Trichonephila clavipes]